MPFLTAYEDFVLNTLGAIPGQLGKLLYLASLRGGDGRYQHWGLARLHGEAAAQNSMQQAHSIVFSDLLRQPLSSLWQEVVAHSQEEGQNPESWLTRIPPPDRLTPSAPGAGAERHLTAVLAALSGLARSPLPPSPLDA